MPQYGGDRLNRDFIPDHNSTDKKKSVQSIVLNGTATVAETPKLSLEEESQMSSIVAAYIVDSMDETMQSYYQTEEYINRQEAINRRLSKFRAAISEAHRAEFNELIDMISADHTETVLKAYRTAFAQGVCFRDEEIIQ